MKKKLYVGTLGILLALSSQFALAATGGVLPANASHVSAPMARKPAVLHAFDAAKYWIDPNSSPYKSGLTTVKNPKVPVAFEQSVLPQTGIARIYVSRGAGMVKNDASWMQEIQFVSYSFKINGQTYTVPAKDRKQQIFILPVEHGIVWAPVNKPPVSLRDVQQALQGATDIYYSPYQSHGGSLANGAQRIAKLPHRWMGIDGPVVASAWAGWLPKNQLAMAHVKSDTAFYLQFSQNGDLKSAAPVKGSVPGWTTLFMRNLVKPAYYRKPHYAAYLGSLTRVHGGLVLVVNFMDATMSGRNAGMVAATYYWSGKTGKWTPLSQNYAVQTLSSWFQPGSDGVYWMQPSPMGDGSGNEMDVTEMHFDPASLTMQAIWLGNWIYGPRFVDGSSLVTVLPNDMSPSASGSPKKWIVYTP